MISKKDIVIFAKRLAWWRSGTRRHLFRPAINWYIGLVIALSVGTGGALYGASIFFSQLSASDRTAVFPDGIEAYDAEEVERTLKTYRARLEVFNTVQGDTPPPVPLHNSRDDTSAPLRAE